MGSLSQNIYIANNMGQDAYVMAGLTEEWQIIDGIVGAVELIAACADVAALPEAVAEFGAEMPAEISTFGDLAKFMKAAAKFANTARKATVGFEGKVSNLVRTFQQNSVHIPAGQFQNVSDLSITGILTPSTAAAFAGADTIQLIVMSGDGCYQTSFVSGADDSWILTSDYYFPRSRYGTIWQQDPSAGTQTWQQVPPYVLINLYSQGLQSLQQQLVAVQRLEAIGQAPTTGFLSIPWLTRMIAQEKNALNGARVEAGLPPLP